MKVNRVSAFRVKRGLRRDRGAELQVVGHPPQTSGIRKTAAMKTFILRRAKGVEDIWPGIPHAGHAARFSLLHSSF
jgi:hypothetical protein